MRFEVSYRSGTTHEVDLTATVAVLGRDPSCDIVLNDTKCSRQHAMVEDGPDGVVIRDSASANGTYVNGRRVRQARVRPGDTIQLGDVKLTLLAEIGQTIVVAPHDLDLPAAARPITRPGAGRSIEARPATPPSHTLPPEPLHGPSGEASASGPPSVRVGGRPLTVVCLALLWALFVPVSVAATLFAAVKLEAGPIGWLLAASVCLVSAGLGSAMAAGLRSLAPWARHLQIAAAAVGLVACPFSLASATVLLYMTRAEVKATFEASPRGSLGRGTGSAEPTFALSILAMLALGLGVSALAVVLLPRR